MKGNLGYVYTELSSKSSAKWELAAREHPLRSRSSTTFAIKFRIVRFYVACVGPLLSESKQFQVSLDGSVNVALLTPTDPVQTHLKERARARDVPLCTSSALCITSGSSCRQPLRPKVNKNSAREFSPRPVTEDIAAFPWLEAAPGFWPAPLHDSSNIFLGGASLQPPALCHRHHPRNIPAQEEPSPRKACRQSQGVVHGNDATPAESMRENTAGGSPTQQRVCVHTARPVGPQQRDTGRFGSSQTITSTERGRERGVMAEDYYSCPAVDASCLCWS